MAGGYAWWGCARQGGVNGKGGMCAGETATEAGGMHPTGMHSCYIMVSDCMQQIKIFKAVIYRSLPATPRKASNVS